jgi:Tfp pilus assembly protein PilN
MRPVNLIPPEQRSGERRPLRTGPLPYLLVGALVAALAGVTALVVFGNQVAERRDELARVKEEDAVAAARAQRLAAYTQFRALREQRLQTIASLADSRFDWERVLRELALVLPQDVWLTNLDASAGGAEGGSGEGPSGSIKGPALQIKGCATGHEAVAGFVTALKEIDGVTRVEVQSSELSDQTEAQGSGTEGGCAARRPIATFAMTAAFDAAPLPQSGGLSEAVPGLPGEGAQTAASSTSLAPGGGG